MSFTSYLIRKFDFSHENIFFRKFSENLNSVYGEKQGEHILIGNIGCNGHQIDAIYITKGQITIIDFKDYSGELTFSENNPWKIKNANNDLLFVQGGAHSRNPFQQVRAYRFSLMDFLSHHSNSFVKNRTNVRWDHIGCMVLFQNHVEFNDDEIPPNVKKYFHIADKNNIINLIDSIYSQGLEFTDNEIQSIIGVLDVKPQNLLEHNNFIDQNAKSLRDDSENLTLIKKLLINNTTDSLYKRVLNYYKTLINVERFKEPEVIETHRLPINNHFEITDYQLDLTHPTALHDLILRNRNEKFPKNLFVVLNILIDGNEHPLLQTIILSEYITNENLIKLNFNDFELYDKSLESLGVNDDTLEELSSSVNTAFNLEEKLNYFRNIMGVTAELGHSILVGLCNEGLHSIQLVSELNTLGKLEETAIRNEIFKGYLYNTNVFNTESDLNLKTIIRVTPLNNSQERAVKLAYKQSLTVVTGPPGTGKSQVVLNIIANAVSNGQSILFASKNNKAIDTIKDRFNLILNEKYLLRTGSSVEINESLKPQLENFISRKNNGLFNDVSDENPIFDAVKVANSRLEQLAEQIKKIPKLEKEIVNTESVLKQKSDNLHKWLDEQGNEFVHIFYGRDENKVKIDSTEVALQINKIENWQKGLISKLFYRWFHKEKFEKEISSINKSQSIEIYEYVQFNAPWVEVEKDILDSSKKNLNFLIDLKAKVNKLKVESEILRQLENSLSCLKNEIDILKSTKENNETEILQIKANLPNLGKEVLNKIVQQRLNKLDSSNTQIYNDYLPAKVWKYDDVADFTQCSRKFISDFKAICLTSLSVKSSFPLKEELFDLLIIDEASQCDIASAIPLIFRSRNVVIIGDPLQLKHITQVKKHEETFLAENLDLENYQLDYVNKSLFDFSFSLANKSSLESVFLEEHYRCHPQIINFSNKYFYERRLGQSMNVQTQEDNFKLGEPGINWINVVGEMHENQNLNVAEVNKCVDLVIELTTRYPNATIGIISPFVHQYRAIAENLPAELLAMVKPETVHKYQGDEKDIIIFTTVVTNNSPASKANFINSKDYLLNVAITRARSALYVIGNFRYCKNLINDNVKTPLSNLANYVESLGRVKEL